MRRNAQSNNKGRGATGKQVVEKSSTPLQKVQSAPKKGGTPEVRSCAQPKPKPKYSIRGTVKNHLGAPLAGAAVTFQGRAATPSPTGQNGAYAFTDLDAGEQGDVLVTAGTRGFLPLRHAIVPLAGDVAARDFQQTAFRIDARLDVDQVLDPGVHFRAFLAAAQVQLSGGHDATAVVGPQGACPFNALPSGESYRLVATCRGVALGVAVDVASLARDEFARFTVGTARVWGEVRKLLLPDEAHGLAVELHCAGVVSTVQVSDTGAFEFLYVPKGFSYTLKAVKAGFTFNEVVIDALAGDAQRNLSLQVFTLKGAVKRLKAGLAGVDIQVVGVRSLTGTVTTLDTGEYSVELPVCSTGYTVTPVKVDCVFEPVRAANVKHTAPRADFQQPRYHVEVTLSGADVATNKYLSRAAGMVGTGTTQRNTLSVRVTGRKAKTPPVSPTNVCTFLDFWKGQTLTADLVNAPGCITCPPVVVDDQGKATLVITLQSFVISGVIRFYNGETGVTANYVGLDVHLKQGSTIVQTVQTDGVGAYTFVAVYGGYDYTVEPDSGSDLITFEPTQGVTPGYRTHELKDLAAAQATCNFTAKYCVAFSEGRANFYVAPGQRAVLSAEMVKNLSGSRDSKHKVRLDLLAGAILWSLNHDGTPSEGYKLTWDAQVNGHTVRVVIGNWRVPTATNDFFGNIITAFHPN